MGSGHQGDGGTRKRGNGEQRQLWLRGKEEARSD